jgi:glycosyltransferase involved in cell wall biosynthesis
MRCPTLTDLPPAPPGRTGWPWMLESIQLPDVTPFGHQWPRISIVTPSYNQAAFLEETVRSVLLQGYPNLEYVVMDGGSTDGSVAVIKKYAKWISYWASAPDGGQCKAINEGFSQCRGDIFAWLNSDDGLCHDALRKVGLTFAANEKVDFIYGNSIYKNHQSLYYVTSGKVRGIYLGIGGIIPQHSSFWRSSVHEELWDRLSCAIDYELWMRIIPKCRKVFHENSALGYANMHPDQKQGAPKWAASWAEDIGLIHSRHGAGVAAPIYDKFKRKLAKCEHLLRKLKSRKGDFERIRADFTHADIVDEGGIKHRRYRA